VRACVTRCLSAPSRVAVGTVLAMQTGEEGTNMNCGAEELRECRVEVSGWDASEKFFVETTPLNWGREGKSEILMQNEVREGCVVFVRLLRAFGSTVEFPVAYRVAKAEKAQPEGSTRALLERLHPKAPFKEPAESAGAPTVYAA